MGLGSLKLSQRDQGRWCALDWTTCMNEKRCGSGGERRKWEECCKNCVSHECNKNVNIPYCGEYLSVDTGWCGVIGMVTKGKNIART